MKSIWDLYRSSRPDGTKPSLKDVWRPFWVTQKTKFALRFRRAVLGKDFLKVAGVVANVQQPHKKIG